MSEQPIQEEYRQKMQSVAASLDELFNGASRGADRKVGFALIVFAFDKPENPAQPRHNYISNAPRPDMIEALEEMLERWKGAA